MKEGIDKKINDTFNELGNILFSFSEEQLNLVPFKGSWTGGQVTEHIIKSLTGMTAFLGSPVEEPGRDPGEKIKALEDLFLNFNIRMQSPEFILPGSTNHKKEELLSTLENLREEMLSVLRTDLSLLCTAFEFPSFGFLTRLEWLHFWLAHTQRHTKQLKNIFHTLKQTV